MYKMSLLQNISKTKELSILDLPSSFGLASKLKLKENLLNEQIALE